MPDDVMTNDPEPFDSDTKSLDVPVQPLDTPEAAMVTSVEPSAAVPVANVKFPCRV